MIQVHPCPIFKASVFYLRPQIEVADSFEQLLQQAFNLWNLHTIQKINLGLSREGIENAKDNKAAANCV